MVNTQFETTPYYLYDSKIIQDRINEIKASFKYADIFYSVKANPNEEICKLIASNGLGAEVVTVGELKIALNAKFNSEQILFAGPGKTQNQIETALKSGVTLFTAESVNQIVLINQIAQKCNTVASVIIRINAPELIENAWESMVGHDSHFGTDINSISTHSSKIKSLENINILGTQYYQGSQILDSSKLSESVRSQIISTEKINSILNIETKVLDIGGGFGVPYSPTEKPLNLKECSSKVLSALNDSFSDLPKIIIESGRFIVAESGSFITKVLDVKKVFNQHIVICDGGFVGFTRPMLTDAFHKVSIFRSKNKSEIIYNWKLCGFSCSSIDSYGSFDLPLPEIGDLLCIANTGAYGYSMSIKNFHSVSSPIEHVI